MDDILKDKNWKVQHQFVVFGFRRYVQKIGTGWSVLLWDVNESYDLRDCRFVFLTTMYQIVHSIVEDGYFDLAFKC